MGDSDIQPDPISTLDANATRLRGGTYWEQYHERDRLSGLSAAYRGPKFQAEHIVGYKVVHLEDRSGDLGRKLEAGMPAYLEVTELHQGHAGSSFPLIPPLTGKGWPSYSSYRDDQRAALLDDVALSKGTALSNSYQLNQLGYAHQISRLAEIGAITPEMAENIQLSTNSFVYMVARDPALAIHSNGNPLHLNLGPKGQAEAVLAREVVVTGLWPSRARVEEIRDYFREESQRADQPSVEPSARGTLQFRTSVQRNYIGPTSEDERVFAEMHDEKPARSPHQAGVAVDKDEGAFSEVESDGASSVYHTCPEMDDELSIRLNALRISDFPFENQLKAQGYDADDESDSVHGTRGLKSRSRIRDAARD